MPSASELRLQSRSWHHKYFWFSAKLLTPSSFQIWTVLLSYVWALCTLLHITNQPSSSERSSIAPTLDWTSSNTGSAFLVGSLFKRVEFISGTRWENRVLSSTANGSRNSDIGIQQGRLVVINQTLWWHWSRRCQSVNEHPLHTNPKLIPPHWEANAIELLHFQVEVSPELIQYQHRF